MDTKKLRQKILDLAIRGKLVPQDPNDEPASVLLERIRAEKERLVKEGKIKRSKKTASDDEIEAPFEIPESWEWCNITEITSKITDGTHNSPPNSSNGIYKYITAKNIKSSGIILDNITYVDETIHNEIYARCNPEYGDILYIKDGATTGVVTINNLDEPFSLLSSVALIKPSFGISNKFLLFYFQSDICLNSVRRSMKGVGITRITLKQIEQWNVPLPPLAEQKRIANAVERWFTLIDELESNEGDLLKAIDKAKSKILDLAIHGKLVPQDPNDEPAIELLKRINPKFEPCDNKQYENIPSTWCWCRLGDLYNIVSAKRVHKSEWQREGIPFYRAREIVRLAVDGYVDNDLFISKPLYEEIRDKYGIPKATDIMISAVGTIGKTYIVKENDLFYYKDASVICLQNINGLYSPFISLLLSSQLLQTQMFDQSKGTTVDTITIEKANSYIIPIPPIPEQLRIVAKIEELFAVLDSIKESLE